MSGNGGEAISAEPIAAQKLEGFEIREGKSEKLQALITNSHSLEPQLLEIRVPGGENRQP